MRSRSLGEYYQDCFMIKCHVPINFNNPMKSDTAFSLGTFIHEYFHFLQNSMTTFGNFRMGIFYARMMNIYNQLSQGISINDVKLDCEGIEVPAQQADIALGDMDDWTYEEYDFIEIENVSFEPDECLGELKNNAVPTIKLKIFKDKSFQIKELNFGAMCIMENMADMLDRHLYGSSRHKEYVQYGICEMLWCYMLGDSIPAWREKLFLSLEFSLMYDNPAQVFYCFLNYAGKIDREENITDNYVFDFYVKILHPNYINTYNKMYIEMMKKFNDIVKESNSYTEHLNKYVVDMMVSFRALRKKRPIIFTNLYKMDKEECKKSLITLMNVGAPLILDKDDYIYAGTKYEEKHLGMEEYAAMYALYRMVGINRELGCVLQPVCEAYKNDIVDSNCAMNPLLHGKYEKLCFLGQLLYMWKAQV